MIDLCEDFNFEISCISLEILIWVPEIYALGVIHMANSLLPALTAKNK